ncbi:hypothetical protein DST30_22860 [Salmonella enterica subsp. enterica serovar Panama]|nr:hypothetical protein [Salmonella enterica subsp. enterica serovar Panama]
MENVLQQPMTALFQGIDDEPVESFGVAGNILDVGNIENQLHSLDETNTVMKEGEQHLQTLNKLRLDIVPNMTEVEERDINTIKHIASTAAAGMGMDPNQIIDGMEEETSGGMSLNMESFDKTAKEATRALWLYMNELYRYAIDICNRSYRRFVRQVKPLLKKAVKLKNLPAYTVNEDNAFWENFPYNWRYLHPRGGAVSSVADLQQTAENIVTNTGILAAWHRQLDPLLMQLLKAPSLENKDNIAAENEACWENILKAINDALCEKPLENAETNDAIINAPVGASQLKVLNIDDYTGTQFSVVWEAIPFQSAKDGFRFLPLNDVLDGTNAIIGALSTLWSTLRQLEFKRCLEASLADQDEWIQPYERLLHQIYDDQAASTAIVQRVSIARNVVGFQAVAFARFLLTVCDVIDGLNDYLDAHLELEETRNAADQ